MKELTYGPLAFCSHSLTLFVCIYELSHSKYMISNATPLNNSREHMIYIIPSNSYCLMVGPHLGFFRGISFNFV